MYMFFDCPELENEGEKSSQKNIQPTHKISLSRISKIIPYPASGRAKPDDLFNLIKKYIGASTEEKLNSRAEMQESKRHAAPALQSQKHSRVHVSRERVTAQPNRFIDITDGELLDYISGGWCMLKCGCETSVEV